MKVRVRFSKQGTMKYIGHLDMVRYFQKVHRRAGVDVAYSEGFSPHQKLSFAAPLGVGLCSVGEYYDMEVHSCESSEKMMEKINAQNVEGVAVLSFKRLPDDAKNAMSVLAAADYMVSIQQPPEEELILDYMAQEEIPVLKKTKKSEKVVNIRQMIYELKSVKNGIFMKLAQGSASNLKPELVVESLYRFMGKEAPEHISLERLDMYCLKDGRLISLDDVGADMI